MAVAEEPRVLERLSPLNRFLPVWIGGAMVAGIVLGRLVPRLDDRLDAVKVGSVSLPIAVGLLVQPDASRAQSLEPLPEPPNERAVAREHRVAPCIVAHVGRARVHECTSDVITGLPVPFRILHGLAHGLRGKTFRARGAAQYRDVARAVPRRRGPGGR